MEQDTSPIATLLTSFVEDNSTYPFPVVDIQKEITQLYFSQDDFEACIMNIYHKLRRRYDRLMANVFITTAELTMNLKEIDIHSLEKNDYYELLDNLHERLTRLQITRIERNTPDGEMLSNMK